MSGCPPTNPTVTHREAAAVGGRGHLALAVAAAIDDLPGVRRSSGQGVEVSTQYPGGRVIGVRLTDREVAVHVTAEQLPLEPVVEAVRSAAVSALREASDLRDVAVYVDDLDVQRLPRGLA